MCYDTSVWRCVLKRQREFISFIQSSQVILIIQISNSNNQTGSISQSNHNVELESTRTTVIPETFVIPLDGRNMMKINLKKKSFWSWAWKPPPNTIKRKPFTFHSTSLKNFDAVRKLKEFNFGTTSISKD